MAQYNSSGSLAAMTGVVELEKTFESLSNQLGFYDGKSTRQFTAVLNNAMAVITHANGVPGGLQQPYAVFKCKMLPQDGDYICINGNVIGSLFGRRDEAWPRFNDQRQPWGVPGEWDRCPVPVVQRDDTDRSGSAWAAYQNGIHGQIL